MGSNTGISYVCNTCIRSHFTTQLATTHPPHPTALSILKLCSHYRVSQGRLFDAVRDSDNNFVYASISIDFCDLVPDADGDSRSGSKEKLDDRKMPKPPPTRTIAYKVKKQKKKTLKNE